MSKSIIILCDGTSNEINSNRTNILRLYGTLKKDSGQLVYYDPGVGTFGAGNDLSYYSRQLKEFWGKVSGWGLDHNVKEAYRFLIEHYQHGDSNDQPPDRIYLFGFSRGAYTVRVLAGLIRAIGILHKSNLNLLDYAYQAYKDIPEDPDDDQDYSEINLYDDILRANKPTIDFMGLFDTVGSVIEQGRYGPRLRFHAFTRRNVKVKAVRQALAIDERRNMYSPLPWVKQGEYRSNAYDKKTSMPQDAKEVWFSGVHSDVGGGYPEEVSALAKLPLYWMIREAEFHGARFKTRTINRIVLGQTSGRDGKHYTKPDPHAELNNSLNLGWRLLDYLPQRRRTYNETAEAVETSWDIPATRRRLIPEGAMVHRSVVERFEKDPQRHPPNLPENFEVVDDL